VVGKDESRGIERHACSGLPRHLEPLAVPPRWATRATQTAGYLDREQASPEDLFATDSALTRGDLLRVRQTIPRDFSQQASGNTPGSLGPRISVMDPNHRPESAKASKNPLHVGVFRDGASRSQREPLCVGTWWTNGARRWRVDRSPSATAPRGSVRLPLASLSRSGSAARAVRAAGVATILRCPTGGGASSRGPAGRDHVATTAEFA